MYEQLSTFRDMEPLQDTQLGHLSKKSSYFKKLMERENLLRGYFSSKLDSISNPRKKRTKRA